MIFDFFRNFDPIQLLIVPAALIAIVLHEMSHGFMARRLGDPTAEQMGRLKLNPIRHIDPIGLLMLVVAGFGWAKPVPVDTRYFKKPKRDLALTALMGPVSNFVIAAVAVLVGSFVYIWYFVTVDGGNPSEPVRVLAVFFQYLWTINLGLAIFNLIPFPPLDGFKILGAFLPDKLYYRILPFERYGMLVLMLLLFTGVLDVPLSWARNGVVDLYYAVFGFPANALSNSIWGVALF